MYLHSSISAQCPQLLCSHCIPLCAIIARPPIPYPTNTDLYVLCTCLCCTCLSVCVCSAVCAEEGGSKEEKPKWKFLQKYYHKGVFYMDSSSMKDPQNDVRAKDYAAEPTLEDRVDKEKLPEVLQVKNFGKRGRTKYTHLLDQDTTVDKQSKKRIDVRADRHIEALYSNRRSGVKKIT